MERRAESVQPKGHAIQKMCIRDSNYTAADAKPQALFCLRKEEEQGKIKKEKKGGSSMNLNEIIAVNLKRLRAERGFSLGKLSELSGVSKVMLSQIEKMCIRDRCRDLRRCHPEYPYQTGGCLLHRKGSSASALPSLRPLRYLSGRLQNGFC